MISAFTCGLMATDQGTEFTISLVWFSGRLFLSHVDTCTNGGSVVSSIVR